MLQVTAFHTSTAWYTRILPVCMKSGEIKKKLLGHVMAFVGDQKSFCLEANYFL